MSYNLSRFIFLAAVLLLAVVGNNGCLRQEGYDTAETAIYKELPEPVRIERNSSLPPRDSSVKKEPVGIDSKIKAREIMKNITLQGGAGLKGVEDNVLKCIAFLVKTFGEPVYKGRINLGITANPKDNGRMAWSDKKRRDRSIYLHEFILLEGTGSELHVLVHELFHALYQSNQLIKTTPDFILEGMAVYAEYKYRYDGNGDKFIGNKLRQEAYAIDPQYATKSYDFDKPFGFYAGRKLDLMYTLSGILFFSQGPKLPKSIIGRIIHQKNLLKSKSSFANIVSRYRLRLTDQLFTKAHSDLNFSAPTRKNERRDGDAASSRKEKKRGHETLAKDSLRHGYYIVVGYYSSNERQVNRVAQCYLDRNFPALTISIGRFNHIRIGPYDSKDGAALTLKKLIKHQLCEIRKDAFVKLY